MTFQEWLKTEAGRMISFEKMPRALEIVWNASAENSEADATLFRNALMQIIGLLESSEPIPVHPTTGKILGRRPRAQKMTDIARSALGDSE